MLPYAPALQADASRAVPSVVPPLLAARLGLVGAWVAALAAVIATDVAPCTPDDPSVCGPDVAWTVASVLCFATPVLLLWLPLLGCAAGAAYGVVEVLLVDDDLVQADVGFGLVGLACAAVGWWLVSVRRRQRAALLAVTAGARCGLPFRDLEASTSARAQRPAPGPVALAAALAVAGAAVLGWFAHADRAEQVHVAAAVAGTARVTAVDDENWVVGLELADGRRVDLDVLDTAPLRPGTVVPVLVDPADDGWVRLVAEPYDPTGWLALGLGVLLLGSVVAGRAVLAARAVRRLAVGQHPALAVDVLPDDAGDVIVLTAGAAGSSLGSRRAVARLRLGGTTVEDEPVDGDLEDDDAPGDADEPRDDEPRDDEPRDDERWDDEWPADVEEAFGRAWRGEPSVDSTDDLAARLADEEGFTPVEPQRGVLVGDLADGGWAAVVVVEDGELVGLLPSAPLRWSPPTLPGDVPRRTRLLARLPVGPWRDEVSAADAVLGRHGLDPFPGRPVPAPATSAPPLTLPHVARPSARARALGGLLVAAGFAGAPVALLFVAQDWFERAMCIALGAQALYLGLARARQEVLLTADDALVRGLFRVESVPWALLHGVRRDGPAVALAWRPDLVIEVGPFADPAGEDDDGYTESVARTMAWLGGRAAASAGPLPEHQHPARPFHPGPGWVIFGLYALAVGAALVWVLR